VCHGHRPQQSIVELLLTVIEPFQLAVPLFLDTRVPPAKTIGCGKKSHLPHGEMTPPLSVIVPGPASQPGVLKANPAERWHDDQAAQAADAAANVEDVATALW